MAQETASAVLVQETASLDLGPNDPRDVPMDVELQDNSNHPTLCVAPRGHVDAITVADRDTSVFRPTQMAYGDTVLKQNTQWVQVSCKVTS